MANETEINQLISEVAALKAAAQGILDFAGGAPAAEIEAAKDRSNHTGTQPADTITDSATKVMMTADERAKLFGILPDINTRSSEAREIACLADERGQASGMTLALLSARLDMAIDEIKQLQDAKDVQMTTYPLSVAASTTAAVAVAAGQIQRLQLQNHSSSVRIGVAFGTAPASVSACSYVIEAGGALDTALVPSSPVYVIAEGTAQVEGAFSVPLNAPNPNWESDFQAIITRMVANGATMPSLLWQDAYRVLYSALRRDGILSRLSGFYMLAAHAGAAGKVNWAGANALTAGVGTPTFVAKSGFVFNDASYFTTGISLGGLTTTLDASAGVWVGTDDQDTSSAAIGDGIFELQPNRAANEVGVRAWAASTSTDTAVAPYYGSFVGAVRTAQAQFTTYLSGGYGEVETRDYVSGYASRPIFIGATNNSTGTIDKFYNGLIRAAMFGKSLSAVQMLAAQVAVAKFFRDIEAL